MNKLFIIGNGFDKAHKMPTGYGDFRTYLKKKYSLREHYVENAPECLIGNHGEAVLDEDSVADFYFNIFDTTLGENWSDFEESLYGLDYNDCFSEPVIDRDGEENIFYTSNNNEDIVNNIVAARPFVEKFFTEWIETIQIAQNVILPFKKVIDSKNDDCFSFNYTNTLEDLYSIKNVCHIHGSVAKGDKLLFGHGNDETEDDYDDYLSENIGTEEGLSKMDQAFRKDVTSALESNSYFFDKIRKADIEGIYSYGFSYGKVDWVYIEKIISLIKPCKWYFTHHDRNERIYLQYEKVIRNLGFQGEINFY